MSILFGLYLLSAIVSFISLVVLLRRDKIFVDDIESTILVYFPIINTVAAFWLVRQLLKE